MFNRRLRTASPAGSGWERTTALNARYGTITNASITVTIVASAGWAEALVWTISTANDAMLACLCLLRTDTNASKGLWRVTVRSAASSFSPALSASCLWWVLPLQCPPEKLTLTDCFLTALWSPHSRRVQDSTHGKVVPVSDLPEISYRHARAFRRNRQGPCLPNDAAAVRWTCQSHLLQRL